MKQEKNCKLHGTALKPENVPVSYGLPVTDELLFEARREIFPNSRLFVLGGCTFGSIGKSSEVLFCADCREAEIKWRKENNRDRKVGKILI